MAEAGRQSRLQIFGIYMYGIGILFFGYMYIVLLLNPRWYSTVASCKVSFLLFLPIQSLQNILKCFPSTASEDTLSSAAATVRRVTHASPSAGSLFLRLGAIVFGVVGVVYYAFLIFLCAVDNTCSPLNVSLDTCAIIFIFTQMRESSTVIPTFSSDFIFCNWKLTITGSHFIARLGTMHLVSANLVR